MSKHATILSGVLLLILAVQGTKSQSVVVPVDIHLPILLKVLSLEKRISDANPQPIVVAILYESTNAHSVEVKNKILEFGGREQPDLLLGASVRFIALDIRMTKNLQTVLEKTNPHALYVAPLSPGTLEQAASAAHAEKILSLTGVPEYVEEGISVGIGVKGDSPEIIINLPSARQEGAEFSSKVLGVARIIE